jgi:ankyrin repeat protein
MTVGFSVSSAVKYAKIGRINQWLETHPDPAELGFFLLVAAGAPAKSAEVVELLIGAGSDPNFIREVEGYTGLRPLSVAAGKSSLDVVKRLVDLGGDVNYSAPDGSNAMNSAVYNPTSSLYEIVEYLISLGIDLDGETKYGESPLSVASHRGKFDIVRLLLDAGADPARLGWNPLMHAVVFGSLSDCRAILWSPKVPLEDRDRLWQRTAFLLATQVGDTEKAALLLAAGADADARGRCGKTALMHAAEMNHVPMVECLVINGADIDAVDEFETTALIIAAEHGAADGVRALLKAGADINWVTHTLCSAIDQAANIETVFALRDAGADINRIAGDGNNLLKYAADREDLEFTKQLLAIDADPNKTTIGDVPLHIAVQRDDVEIVRALLQHGANPNAQDVDGWTPLFSAKSIEVAELLLDAGADPNATEKLFGQTALDYVPEQLRTFLASEQAKHDR